MMTAKTLIKPLDYHKGSRKIFDINFHDHKIPLGGIGDDLGKYRHKACHTSFLCLL